MKSMLYVGAALMIGASIYGFVDYRENSQKKEFKELYDHNEVKKTVIGEEKTALVTEKKEVAPVEEKVTTSVKNSGVKKTVAAETELKTAPVSGGQSLWRRHAVTEVKKVANKPVVKKKKKKFSHRDFSRAPLREDQEVLKVEPAKVEVKKIDNKQKEQ